MYNIYIRKGIAAAKSGKGVVETIKAPSPKSDDPEISRGNVQSFLYGTTWFSNFFSYCYRGDMAPCFAYFVVNDANGMKT